MNDFWIWFDTGFHHILDWSGYDHILYIIALCVLFPLSDWKKLLILVTAFTIGHSLTLASSVLNMFAVKQTVIEVLIPLTIIVTCLINIYVRNRTRTDTKFKDKSFRLNYLMALGFGFIHGMGFSYLLRALLGKEESILWPLLSFNLGLEFGQLLVVGFTLLLSVFLVRFAGVRKADYVFFVSAAVFGISFLLFVQRLNTL